MFNEPPAMFPQQTVSYRIKWKPDRGSQYAKEGYYRQAYSSLIAQWVSYEYLGTELEKTDSTTQEKEG